MKKAGIIAVLALLITSTWQLEYYVDSSDVVQDCTPRCLDCQTTCQTCAGGYTSLVSDSCLICDSNDLEAPNGDGTCAACPDINATLCLGEKSIVCSNGKRADLNGYICVDICTDSNAIPDYEMNDFCGDFPDIYVDPSNETPFSIGTQEFPYKDLEGAFEHINAIQSTETRILIKESTTAEFYSKFDFTFTSSIQIESYCDAGTGCNKAEIQFNPTQIKSQHWTDAFTLYYTSTQQTSGDWGLQGADITMMFDNIKLVANEVSFISVKSLTFENSIIMATGSTVFNAVEEFLLSGNEITLDSSVLLQHSTDECNRNRVDIVQNTITLMNQQSAIVHCYNLQELNFNSNEINGDFSLAVDTSLIYFDSDYCSRSELIIDSNILSAVDFGSGYLLQAINAIQINFASNTFAGNTVHAELMGLVRTSMVYRIDISSNVVSELYLKYIFSINSRQIMFEGNSFTDIQGTLLKTIGQTMDIQIDGNTLIAPINDGIPFLYLFQIEETVERFRVRNTEIDGVASHFIEVFKNEGDFTIQNVQLSNVELQLTQPWFKLHANDADAVVTDFRLHKVVNTNAYVTDIFTLMGYEIIITNFTYDDVIEISFGIKPEPNANGEKKEMIVQDCIFSQNTMISFPLINTFASTGSCRIKGTLIQYIQRTGIGNFDPFRQAFGFHFQQCEFAHQVVGFSSDNRITYPFTMVDMYIHDNTSASKWADIYNQPAELYCLRCRFENEIYNTFCYGNNAILRMIDSTITNIELMPIKIQIATLLEQSDPANPQTDGRFYVHPNLYYYVLEFQSTMNAPSIGLFVPYPAVMTIEGTTFDNVDQVVRAYNGSSITFKDCSISDLSLKLDRNGNSRSGVIQAALATVVLERTTFSQVDGIILPFKISQYTSLAIEDVTVSDSILNIFSIFIGQVTINGLVIRDHVITNESNASLMNLYSCTFTMVGAVLENINVLNNQPLIDATQTTFDMDSSHISNTNQEIFYGDNTATTMTNSRVETFEGMSAFIISHSPAAAVFEGNTFIDCKTNQMDGGALRLIDLHEIHITGCTFEGNHAQSGGAVAIENGQVLDNLNFSFSDCDFRRNTAEIQGGAVTFNQDSPVFTDCRYEGNSAPYGDDVASYPIKIKFEEDPDGPILMASGQEVFVPFKILLLDNFDNIIANENTKDIEIKPKSQSGNNIEKQGIVRIQSGIFLFDQLVISANRETAHEFTLQTDGIDIEKVRRLYPEAEDNWFELDISFFFRQCVEGEKVDNEQGTYTQCLVCSSNTFSLEPNSPVCENCPTVAECKGGTHLELPIGYWRSDYYSGNVEQCLFEGACLGGAGDPNEEGSPVKCARGYRGLLCHECIYDENLKFTRLQENQCGECLDKAVNAFRLLGVLILILSFILFMVWINARAVKFSETSLLMRNAINYFQIVSMITLFDMNWPDFIKNYFGPSDVIGSGSTQMFSVDCYLKDNYDVTDSYFIEGALAFASPFFVSLFFLMIWIVLKIFKRVNKIAPLVYSTLFTSVFVLQPSLMNYGVSLFNCQTVGELEVLKDLMDIECWSDQHNRWAYSVGVFTLLFWVLGFCIFVFVLLRKNKNRLEEVQFKQKFRVYYEGYSPDTYYFELVNTGRKLIMLMIIVYQKTTFNLQVKGIISLFFLSVYVSIQDRVKPCVRQDFNSLQTREAIASVVTLYAGLLSLQSILEPWVVVLIFAFTLLVNIWFWGLWLLLLVTQGPLQTRKEILVNTIFCVLRCKRPKSVEAIELEERNDEETDLVPQEQDEDSFGSFGDDDFSLRSMGENSTPKIEEEKKEEEPPSYHHNELEQDDIKVDEGNFGSRSPNSSNRDNSDRELDPSLSHKNSREQLVEEKKERHDPFQDLDF